MNTKTLSNRALNVLDQYSHFSIGQAVCSVPYFNNKTVRARAALRATIGKGSPRDILEEVQMKIAKEHVATETLTNESLKNLLVDNDIGIDCSAFAYYILSAESEERGKGALDRHISFVNCGGFIGKIRCKIRPVENCDVATFASDKNSKIIPMKEVQPGDMITMTGSNEGSLRDHILVIHQIEYQNFVPTKVHYSHAVAYPEDGVYGSGIKQGTIEIISPDRSILEGIWTESGSTAAAARIFVRAKTSKTELRRMLSL